MDNAPGPEELLNYIPQGSAGHVLITSRNPSWGGVAGTLLVREFQEAEALEFLLRRTNQTDEAGATTLAKELGYLPLALEQAGAYVEATGRSLSDYLELFHTRQRQLLRRGRPADYPATVATTWDISMQQAREASPASPDLLSLCAFLAPDDIPRELLSQGTEHLPKSLARVVADPTTFDDAVAALRRYSLVGAAGDALSVHRLVQAVARDRLATRARKRWAEAAVRLVDAAFPFAQNDLETWAPSARLLPHAVLAAGHAQPLEVAPDATGRLLNQVGMYLRGRAQFAQAREAHERALRIDEAAYGPDHPTVAIRVNNLGGVLQGMGDLAGAQAHYERALRIDEAAYGPDHPTVATYVNNLGSVLQEMGDPAGARAHYERALRIDEAALGPDHPSVATRVNNLGDALREMGDLAGARAHFERALAIGEVAYGPDHPTVATRVNNLGSVLRELGDLAGARAHFERALRIGEAAYGPDHPTVAIRVNNLGDVLQELGDLAGARAHLQRAVEVFRQSLGEDHPSTATVRENLEQLEAEMARRESAEEGA